MSVCYEVLAEKKRCTMCGCHMYSESESDICEICLDELYESDPGEEVINECY